MYSPSGAATIQPVVIPFPEAGGSDKGDDTGLALELEPSFTTEDEQKELTTLSISDIVSLQSDLRGITSGVSGLGVDGSGADRAQQPERVSAASPGTAAALSRLDKELSRLPASETAAYRRALKECPNQVSDERKMAFLEYEDGDAMLAAKRLAKYWEIRLDLFGADRCFLPMTLAGAMKDEFVPMIKMRIWYLMPVTDTAGRAIIYMNPSRRNFDEYSVDQENMAFMYLMETVIEDADLRRRGVIVIYDGSNMERKHYSRKLMRFAGILDEIFPVRIRAGHCCHPSKVFYYIIHPVVQYFLPQDLRLRMKLHYGSTAEVLRDLEGYCLPRDRLPTDIGGDVVLDMEKWVMERMALESSRTVDPNIRSLDVPATKRLRSDNREDISVVPVPAPETLAPTCTPATTENSRKQSGKGRGKGKNRGKRSDPRMARAIEAKLADPDLPLHDALISGGFVFREDDEMNDMVDTDGITLAQRKNNLCRRIRKEKQKRAEQYAVDSIVSSTNVASEQDVMSNPMSIAVKAGSALEGSDEASGVAKLDTNCMKDNQRGSNDNVVAAAKRDSFYESILGLPGINDMDGKVFLDEDG